MKRTTQLLAMSVLMFGVHQVAMSASTDSAFPADAEASYDLQAIESYAEQQARMGEGAPSWGVSKREAGTDSFLDVMGFAADGPFPSRGGPIDN
jgi:hypothetical protein